MYVWVVVQMTVMLAAEVMMSMMTVWYAVWARRRRKPVSRVSGKACYAAATLVCMPYYSIELTAQQYYSSKLFTYLPIPQHTFLLITLQFYYKGQYISTKSILQFMLKHCNTIVSILVSFSIIVVPLHELSSVLLHLSQTRVTCLQTSPSCLRTKHSNDRPKFICTISGLLYLFSMLKLFLLDCKKSVCKDMPHALLLFSLPRVILPA